MTLEISFSGKLEKVITQEGAIPATLYTEVLNEVCVQLPMTQRIELKVSYETMGAPIIQDMLFREEAGFEELKSLKTCKSPGTDETPAKLLLEVARELAKPLSFLCQKPFDTGMLPTDWKTAHITPLHESGSRVLATNNRPVSRTSIGCKVMEKVVKM
ncbi:unnamed protein product [Schistocephalus solidus]|uniref:Reverse transcriptase domain-containing protein n=1 Tax=Schistocephalus solidus TaxID=70667 RepID=A0A183SN68_SCHSO|nr:unnamed protein product [Schistocephalus solidus]